MANEVAHYEHVDSDGVILEGTAVEVLNPNALALLNSSEIDTQIATARKYPRSLANFTKEVRDLVTLDAPTAQSCIYALPRAGKSIEGASIRFAEMVNYSWGNTRVASRIVEIGDEFVTVEGMFFDLEKNTATKSEVIRRITNKSGKRFDADMIQVTGAAAGAIARRNAILTGIPKTLWMPMYEGARKVVAGDVKTLVNRVDGAIKAFAIFGIQPPQIYGLLGVKGIEEMTTEHVVTLGGIHTAIKEKQTTPEAAFAEDKWPKSGGDRPTRDSVEKKAKLEKKEADPAKVETKEEPKKEGPKAETKSEPEPKKDEPVAEQESAPKEEETPATRWASWKREQWDALKNCQNARTLDVLENTVLPILRDEGTAEEVAGWETACKARFQEITAGKKKK